MCNNKEELTKLVRKQRKATALKKKLEDRIDALNAEISEYVCKKGDPNEKGTTFVVFGDDFKVSVCVITQYRWDNDKLKPFLGNSVRDYQYPNTYSKVDIR